jgi:hypothetical protein
MTVRMLRNQRRRLPNHGGNSSSSSVPKINSRISTSQSLSGVDTPPGGAVALTYGSPPPFQTRGASSRIVGPLRGCVASSAQKSPHPRAVLSPSES